MKYKKEISNSERQLKCYSEIEKIKILFKETDKETQKLNSELIPFFKRLGIRYQEEDDGIERLVEIDYSLTKGNFIFLNGINRTEYQDEDVEMLSRYFAMAIIMIYPSLKISKTFPKIIAELEKENIEIVNLITENESKASSKLKHHEKSLKDLKKELKLSETQLSITRNNTDQNIIDFEELKHKIPFLN